MCRIILLLISLLFLVLPLVFYGYLVLWQPELGARLGAGLAGLGVYLYYLLQVGYYACGIRLAHMAIGGLVFLLIVLSTFFPDLMELFLLAVLAMTIFMPLHMGIRLGVFAKWLHAIVWLIAWNILSALIAFLPVRLWGLERAPWMWYVEPPIPPARGLVIGSSGVVSTILLGLFWKSINKCR